MTQPLLDWRDPKHYSNRALPCRYCGKPTNLRDSKNKPAHKTCAENALAVQAAEAADAYQNENVPADPNSAGTPTSSNRRTP